MNQKNGQLFGGYSTKQLAIFPIGQPRLLAQ
jgi:hypothetical protein